MAWHIAGAKAAGVAAAGMRAAAGSGDAAVKFSKNLASVRPESWKAGAQMMRSLRDIDWDKGSAFMSSTRSTIQQLGIFGEIMMPFLNLLSILDAALIEEYVEEITALNEMLTNETAIEGMRILASTIKLAASGSFQTSLSMWNDVMGVMKVIDWDVIWDIVKKIAEIQGGGGGDGGGGDGGPTGNLPLDLLKLFTRRR